MMNITVKRQAERAMNEAMPYEELSYRNAIVATIIANGHKEKLTSDWLRNTLLGDVEDGFLTYGQAVAIKDEYYKAIQTVASQF